MEINWVVIIYMIFLIDSIGVVTMSWFGQKWWMHYAQPISKYFPPAKGWAIVYFTLILIIGYLLGLL